MKSFIKDIAKYSPSQLLPALTAFITTPILTRLLPPSEYGNWALAASVSAFLVALAVSGFGAAAIRFYPAYKSSDTLKVFFTTMTGSVAVVIAIVTILSFLVLFFLKDILPAVLGQLLYLIVLSFIVQSIFTMCMAVMRAQGRSGAFTTFQLVINYGGLGIGILLVLILGLQADGLLWGAFLAHVLALPFMIFGAIGGVGVQARFFRVPDAVQIWQYSWPLVLGNVAMWGLRLSDLFIIGFFGMDRDVGLYTVSYNISSRSIELLVSLFLLSVSPLIMSTWENGGREATEKALTMVTRVYLLLCLPASIGLTVLASPFVTLLAAPEYHEGYKIVGFVVFSSFAWGLANIAMMGIAIKKQVRRLAINQIVSASLHIGLALLLVPRFGYAVAAVTTLVGYTTLFVLQTLSSNPYLAWRFPFRTLYNVLAASLAMGLVTAGICWLSGDVGHEAPLYLFLGILAGVPTYAVCLWLSGEIREEEKQMFMKLFVRDGGAG